MSHEQSKIILELEDLKIRGKYDEILDKVDLVLQSKEIAAIEKIQAKIIKCDVISFLGQIEFNSEKLDEGYSLSTDLISETKKLGDIFLIFDAYCCNTRCLLNIGKNEEYLEGVKRLEEIFAWLKEENELIANEKGVYLMLVSSSVGKVEVILGKKQTWDFNETIELLEKGIKEARNFENKEILSNLLYSLADTHFQIGQYDKSMEVVHEAMEIAEENNNEYLIAHCLREIGLIYWMTGKYNSFLKTTKKALEIKEKIGNQRFLAISIHFLGIFYWETGDWKEALKCFQKAYDIWSENGKRSDEIQGLHNLAMCYRHSGELDKALEYLKNLYEIQKKKNDIKSYFTLNSLADIYLEKGELDKALELSEESLKFNMQIGAKRDIAINCDLISTVYERKGSFKKALNYREKTIKIYTELGNKTHLTDSLYRNLILASNYNRMDLAKEYYNKIEMIVKEIDHKNYKQLTLLAESVILKGSKETRDRDRAELIFDHLLQEDVKYMLRIEILLQLSDLLLFELKATSNERYLSKLQKNISNLVDIGMENNIPLIVVESLWFKSQLSLLNLDFDKTRELLTQALNIAEDKGLNHLALKVTRSKEELIRRIIELENLELTSPSLSEKMELIDIDKGFKEIRSSDMFQFKQNI